MVLYQYYHRRKVTGDKEEFFDESIASAAHKELDTNMLKEHMVTADFAVDRLIVYLEPLEVVASGAEFAAQLDNQTTLVNEGVLIIQIGDLPRKYYRVCECLDNIAAGGCASSESKSTNGSTYQLIGVYPTDGEKGREVDFTIPAETNFMVTLETVTGLSNALVVIILSGSE